MTSPLPQKGAHLCKLHNSVFPKGVVLVRCHVVDLSDFYELW